MIVFTVVAGIATLVFRFLPVKGHFPRYGRHFLWASVFLFALMCGWPINLLAADRPKEAAAATGNPDEVDQSKPGLKTETFARDPAWEGYNNRIVPSFAPLVTQDFGYSATNFAAKSRGEVGGRITRASEPAWYAARIPPKTLDDKLSASGTFALVGGGGGICFGWLHGQQPSGMGRPLGSLAMNVSAAKTGGRLSVHLVTARIRLAAPL